MPVWVNGLHCCLGFAIAAMEAGMASLWCTKLESNCYRGLFPSRPRASAVCAVAAPHTRQGVATSNAHRVCRPADGVKGPYRGDKGSLQRLVSGVYWFPACL